MSVPKTCPWMMGVGSRVSTGWVHLPDGKTLVPCRPRADFSTSFTHHINLFSLIMWCQGTYLYKLLSLPILAGSGQHPGPASGAIWPCWMKLKWPSAAPRPDLCLLEEKQEGSIAIFSSSGLAKFQARLEGVVGLRSCLSC